MSYIDTFFINTVYLRINQLTQISMKETQSTMVDCITTVQGKIYEFRGKYVILDRDLAVLYGVEVKRINEQVRRNKERFPEDFMFQLTKEECLRSQFATLKTEQGKHLKYMPYAFTELGVAMLSSVLRSPIAIQVNINIMRAFVAMREQIHKMALDSMQYHNLKLEMDKQKDYIEDILRDQNDTNELIQGQIDAITDSLTELSLKVQTFNKCNIDRKPVGFIIPTKKE